MSKNEQFYNDKILSGISKDVKLHEDYESPHSSAAACMNVLGYLNQNQKEIIPFFKEFGLKIEEVVNLPSDFEFDGQKYDDIGPIIFEWIGPKKSPINEERGTRGQNKTSIDAYFIAKINGKYSQIFIEWKYTESYNRIEQLHKFGGKRGIERLKRYSSVLAEQRNKGFPFNFKEEDTLGLFDFSYEPLYQLLRITLLAKKTTPVNIGGINIEDYYVIHLVHSKNAELLTLKEKHTQFSPGIKKYIDKNLHDVWKLLLSDEEKSHFYCGFWDNAIKVLDDETKYLEDRYVRQTANWG